MLNKVGLAQFPLPLPASSKGLLWHLHTMKQENLRQLNISSGHGRKQSLQEPQPIQPMDT